MDKESSKHLRRTKMPKAYVLINCQIGTQEKILNQLKKVPGVVQRLAK